MNLMIAKWLLVYVLNTNITFISSLYVTHSVEVPLTRKMAF